MKFLKFSIFLLLILFSLGMRHGEGEVTHIEGLFYRDNLPIRIDIRDGKILDVVRIGELSDKDNKAYIAPGLFDNQVNGYHGTSFVYEGSTLTVDDILDVTHSLWKAGVTTYLPTLRTSGRELLLKNLPILARAMDNPSLKGSIPGFHMEGPYVSPEDGYRGAHALKNVQKPDWKNFMEYYKASGEHILQVTLAPEVENAMEFITKLRDKGIVVGLGHHNANMQQVSEAADRGAQISTHLGNAMANMINRHENPLWPQLSDDRLMASIIVDGFHLRPEEVRVFYKVKGTDRTVITSDVTRYAGMAPGKYLNTEGDTILLTEDGAARYLARNSLSGSASPVTKGVGNIMKWTGCSLAEAIQMSSTNQAKLYSLSDRGKIQPGMRADIIKFTLEDFKLNIKKTIVAGDLVYEADK